MEAKGQRSSKDAQNMIRSNEHNGIKQEQQRSEVKHVSGCSLFITMLNKDAALANPHQAAAPSVSN